MDNKMFPYTALLASALIYILMIVSFLNEKKGLGFPVWIQIFLLVAFIAAIMDSYERKNKPFMVLFSLSFILIVISIFMH